MKKNILWLTILACGLIYLAPHLFFWYKLGTLTLSNDSAIWGQYGDFIGGSLNPILGILNIIALVYLTFRIAEIEKQRLEESEKLEDKRYCESIELENKRMQDNLTLQKIITLTKMRTDVVKDLNQKLEDFFTKDKVGSKEYRFRIVTILQAFGENNSFLFRKLFDDGFEKAYLQPLIKSLEAINNYIKDDSNSEDSDPKVELTVFLIIKTAFFSTLNNFIVTEINAQKIDF